MNLFARDLLIPIKVSMNMGSLAQMPLIHDHLTSQILNTHKSNAEKKKSNAE